MARSFAVGEGLNAAVGVAELLANRGADVELLTPSFSRCLASRGAEGPAYHGTPSLIRREDFATSYLKEIGDHEFRFDVYSEGNA